MSKLKFYKENSEVKFAVKEIDKWYKKEDSNILNIITMPYNSNIIFEDIVNGLIRRNLKVLYIINDENYEYIINSYELKNFKNFQKQITFINSKNLFLIKDIYDLIIYDDISSYSNYKDVEIKLNIDIIYKKSPKIIVYTMEKVLNYCDNIYINNIIHTSHFVEPRVITTKTDLNFNIPCIMYDYLKWFKKNRRNVIIIVPTKECIFKLYNLYIENILKNGDIRIRKASSMKEYKEICLLNKVTDKPIILITDYIGDYIKSSNNIDFVFYFADNKIYNYKKFIYVCGKVISKDNTIGEVILISNKITNDIEKARNVSRRYNKILWAKRLY